MPRSSARTERQRRDALATWTALSVAAAAAGAARIVWTFPKPGAGAAVSGLGLAMLLARLALPRGVAMPAVRLHQVLTVVGRGLSDAVLVVVYLGLLWPYRLLLVALGRMEAPGQDWPPTLGWLPLDPQRGWTRLSRTGSGLARLLARAGAGMALLQYFARRPSAALLPVVALLLLLAALLFLANATGLGPLIYTLF
jgi:hypothetical protein